MKQYLDLKELLQDICAIYGDRTAILSAVHNEKVRITYRQLYEAVMAKVTGHRENVRECFGLCGEMTPSWILHAFAEVIQGKRVVMIDPMLSAEETARVIRETGVDFLYCDNRAKYQLVRSAVDRNQALVREKEEAGDETIPGGGSFIFYSSGTTGEEKPCVLSQAAILDRVYWGNSMIPVHAGETCLAMIPFSHIFGFVCCLLWPLVNGVAVAIGRGLRYMADDTNLFRPEFMCLVPAQLQYLLSRGALNPELKHILVGAESAPAELFAAARARHIAVYYGYGLTEAASGIAMSDGIGDPHALRICPGTRVSISDQGEILVTCGGLMDGYWHDEAATKEKIRDGVLYTGDTGYLDPEGRLFVEGRLNDVLTLPGGRKLACTEVERELAKTVETQVALTLQGGKLTLVAIAGSRFQKDIEEKVRTFNETNREGIRIEQVVLRDDPFPRTVSGKIKRYAL